MEGINNILELETTNISKEQLQDVYITTQRLRKANYDDCNELSDDQLKYEIAYNLYYLSSYNT